MMISGLLGCFVTSPIVAKTKKYKLASLLINILAAIGTILFAFTLYVENVVLTCFCAALIGFGMMPMTAFMIELACELTYPVGEAMSTGLLNLAGQVVGVAGVFIVDQLLFSPLLANLVIAACMVLAGALTLLIKENFARAALDKEGGKDKELMTSSAVYAGSVPESPLLDSSSEGVVDRFN